MNPWIPFLIKEGLKLARDVIKDVVGLEKKPTASPATIATGQESGAAASRAGKTAKALTPHCPNCGAAGFIERNVFSEETFEHFAYRISCPTGCRKSSAQDLETARKNFTKLKPGRPDAETTT
jgi:hypothetical protein